MTTTNGVTAAATTAETAVIATTGSGKPKITHGPDGGQKRLTAKCQSNERSKKL